ncbi:unnamed protein product, partial [Polarella glacialis]
GPAAADPGSTAPPAAASLAAAPPAVQKQMIGEMLYPRIAKLQPGLAGQITGMMLELDNSELLILLESDAQLKGKVDEALRAAQAASECPALAEERFELEFFAEVSVKNQFDLLTNCPHYATTSPGGASSLPSPVPNVAGSEAAEAVSEDPALTAERPGPEFFPEASGEKQVEVITYGVDVAATPPGGASSAGAAGSGMIETVRDRQAGSASSSASVPSSGATASSAIVTASPRP